MWLSSLVQFPPLFRTWPATRSLSAPGVLSSEWPFLPLPDFVARMSDFPPSGLDWRTSPLLVPRGLIHVLLSPVLIHFLHQFFIYSLAPYPTPTWCGSYVILTWKINYQFIIQCIKKHLHIKYIVTYICHLHIFLFTICIHKKYQKLRTVIYPISKILSKP